MARELVSVDDTTRALPAAVIAANQGTEGSDFAAGNDSRITGAAQKSANLSDLANAATARTNLGLGTAATTAATAYATAAQGTKADTATQPADLTPGPAIVCWGDSLTADGTYPTALATILGATVTNCGVGGESSRGIAARQGGAPYRLLPAGNQIPASGGVTVTLSPADTWPLIQGPGGMPGTLAGTLAGVPGTLTITKVTPGSYVHEGGDVYTFTRTTPGDAVTVARPTAFLTTTAAARRGDLQIIWAGTTNYTDQAQVVADVKAMTRWAEQAEQRFLVLGLHNGRNERTGTTIGNHKAAINTALAAEYGERFVDIGAWLVTWGLADAGIQATEADTLDASTGVVPGSLRADSLHLTATGYTIVARQVAKRLAELGWATIAVPWSEPVAAAALPNLITNGEFETDLTGWEAMNGAAITRPGTLSNAGTYCVQIDHAADTTSGMRTSLDAPIPAAAGACAVRWVVNGPVGHIARLTVHCFDAPAGGNYLGNQQSIQYACNADWLLTTSALTFPVGTTHIILEINKAGASEADDVVVWVDSIQLSQ